MNTAPAKFCSQCGTALPAISKFCPGCGINLALGSASHSRSPLTPKAIVVIGLVSVGIWAIGWNINSNLAGAKPTVTYEAMTAKNQTANNDPAVARLRESTTKNPEDVGAWKALAEALFAKLDETEQPPQQLVLETVDVLREILRLDPNDRMALRGMADVSLNQQVFPESVKYFEKYLKLEPKDFNARARYASALTFSGKADNAIKELRQILKEDPTNFHAAAYLAVTYAQKGDKQASISAGETALKLAPSDEARARFGTFIDQVKSGKGSIAMGSEAPPETMAQTANAQIPDTAADKPGLQGVSDFIKGNPVAGRKFVKIELEGREVKLFFTAFPMDAMPPFVKDKFVNSVKEKTKVAMAGAADAVVFLDNESGNEMTRAQLK